MEMDKEAMEALREEPEAPMCWLCADPAAAAALEGGGPGGGLGAMPETLGGDREVPPAP